MSEPEGITNHPASTETAEDSKLKGPTPPPDQTEFYDADEDKDLPKGMAEKVETINVNTMHPNK